MNTESDKSFCTTEPHRLKLTAHVKAGGCAAKIAPAQLAEIVRDLPKFSDPRLLTTIESFEDAAVYKVSEELALVQTIDFFPPVVDDPFLFGQIAAVNAISDVYAMGGTPVMAMSVLCFPTCDFPLSMAQEIVAGGAAALKAARAALVGGHSIQAPEPIYGLAVTGTINPQQILTNGGAKVGDALVLTKRIGSGALLLAHKAEILSEHSAKELFDSLTQLNKAALEIALRYNPHGATDVTGFGLLGHAHEMAKASGLQCRIFANSVPLFTDALSYASEGLVPAGAYANRKAYERIAYINDEVELAIADLLFDPQTSGGLMFAVEKSAADDLAKALQSAGLTGSIIGEFKAGTPGQVEVISQ
jgi:selenide,water dikinase